MKTRKQKTRKEGEGREESAVALIALWAESAGDVRERGRLEDDLDPTRSSRAPATAHRAELKLRRQEGSRGDAERESEKEGEARRASTTAEEGREVKGIHRPQARVCSSNACPPFSVRVA